jgi:hypothetical protein
MKVKSQKDLFLLTLSDLRKGTETATRVFEEITQVVKHPDIEEAVEAQAFISPKAMGTIDSACGCWVRNPWPKRTFIGYVCRGLSEWAARNPEQRGSTSFLAGECQSS